MTRSIAQSPTAAGTGDRYFTDVRVSLRYDFRVIQVTESSCNHLKSQDF